MPNANPQIYSPGGPVPNSYAKADSSKKFVILTFALGFLVIVLIGVTFWAVRSRAVAVGTVEQRIAEATATAREEQRQADLLAEQARGQSTTREYIPPPVFGNLSISFPKDWNVYVAEDENDRIQLDGYIHPEGVRISENTVLAYAFRFSLEDELYSRNLGDYERQINNKELTKSDVTVSGIAGVKLTGKITRDQSGTLIMLPVRDKTLRLWTEGQGYAGQYETIISQIKISP